jgi:hypothetical protein
MGSPFPGMDPYIEARHLCDDFHHNLIGLLQAAIGEILPKRYVVRAGERSYVSLTARNDRDEYEYRMQADVTVARTPTAAGEQSGAQPIPTALLADAGGTVDAEFNPITMLALVRTEFHESFLEIREAYGDRQVVTAIEVLSPSNKRFGAEGWFEYLRKRRACLSGMVHFAEIDLLRLGRRMPMDDQWPQSPYYFLLCRKEQAPRCTVWPASYKRPLPSLVVPLLPPDPDVAVPIQPLIGTIYARSRYGTDIDYQQPLRPPLNPADQGWLDEQLRQQQSSA